MERTKQHNVIANPKVKTRLRFAATIFFLLTISTSLLSACQHNNAAQSDNSKLTIGGVIEGDCTRIGVPFAGRVVSVAAKEGAAVNKGQELIHLDSSPLEKQKKWTDKLIQTATEEKARTKILLAQLRTSLKQCSSQITPVSRAGSFTPDSSRLQLQSDTKAPIKSGSALADSSSSTAEKTSIAGNPVALKEVEQAQDFQLNLIAEAEKSMKATVDAAYNQQLNLLKEARKQALKENTENKFFGLNPVHKTKEKAIASVFDAKEDALNSAHEAQKQAIAEVIADKQSALKETIKIKKMALKEMQAGQDSIVAEIGQEKKQIEAEMLVQQKRLSSVIKNLSIKQQVLQKLTAADKSGQQKMITLQIDQAQARLALIDTELTKAEAMQDEIASKIELCSIKSPLDGTCISRSVQPGELAAPGPTLIKVLDNKSLYARAFVSKADLSAVKLGQTADLQIDGPKVQTIPAKVVAIDSQPCFSPERMYFKEDRAKETFGIKLSFDDNTDITKPGMPVEVNLTIKGQAR